MGFMAGDQQWRAKLTGNSSSAFNDLGETVRLSAGTRPLLAEPLMWQSQREEERTTTWHALAVTDRFVVTAEMNVVDRSTTTSVARVVPFSEVADIEWHRRVQTPWNGVRTSVTMRLGSFQVTLPPPNSFSEQLSEEELGFVHAVSSNLGPVEGS